MTVPTYQELMLPLLQKASEQKEETSIAALSAELGAALGLTQEDLAQRTPGRNVKLFPHRLHWAKQYMTRAGLLESTRYGHFCITEQGRTLLAENPVSINRALLQRYPEFNTWFNRSTTAVSGDKTGTGPEDEASDDRTPEEQVEAGVVYLKAELEAEVLDRLRRVTPAQFEKIVIDLLIAMGYGGGNPEMGEISGGPGDGGVDGVIKEDSLGLDAVYVQAKRYGEGNRVNGKEMQNFIGALATRNAQKGVFITTSVFALASRELVRDTSHRIIMIEGDELARLIVQYNVGVRVRQTYTVKRVDEDYFSE